MTGDKALLIIDMLNDFVLDGAPLKVPKIKKQIITRKIYNLFLILRFLFDSFAS